MQIVASDLDRTEDEVVVAATVDWLERIVIGLNLCPFARSVHLSRQIRFVVSQAASAVALAADLERELVALTAAPPAAVETTLLIHPYVLGDFLDYNDFLDEADAVLDRLALTGEIQVASFHPGYRFGDAPPDDPANYTNRSPYPMLHLLREASVARAVASMEDAEAIPARNVETMRRLGHEGVRLLARSPRSDKAH
jgi:hypothetical protein